MKCCRRPSAECCGKRLGWTTLNHSVIDSSFSVSPSLLFSYRLFVFLFCVFAFICDFIYYNTVDVVDAVAWFEYLTHWDAINLIIYFGLSSYFTLLAIKDPARSLVSLASSRLACAVHFMFELSFLSGWFVSILYWTALYPTTKTPPEGYWAFMNVCMHGLPALWVTVDLFLGSHVLVHFHLWMMYLYFLVYLAVNAAITLITLKPVYGILTFESPTTAIWIAISLVLILLLWLAAHLAIRLRTRCCSRKRSRSVVVFSKEDPKPYVEPVG